MSENWRNEVNRPQYVKSLEASLRAKGQEHYISKLPDIENKLFTEAQSAQLRMSCGETSSKQLIEEEYKSKLHKLMQHLGLRRNPQPTNQMGVQQIPMNSAQQIIPANQSHNAIQQGQSMQGGPILTQMVTQSAHQNIVSQPQMYSGQPQPMQGHTPQSVQVIQGHTPQSVQVMQGQQQPQSQPQGNYGQMQGMLGKPPNMPGQLQNMQGGQIQNMQGGQLQNIQGGQLQSMQGGQLQNIQGGQLQNIQGGQLQNMQGGQLQNMQSTQGGQLQNMQSTQGGQLQSLQGQLQSTSGQLHTNPTQRMIALGQYPNDMNMGSTTSIPQVRQPYSPGPGVSMHSPNAGMTRYPQPSPSLNMNVNTPAPSVGLTPQDQTAPSPASFVAQQPVTSPDDNQTYMEKMRELSVYVEPLKKMINDMNKENKNKSSDYQKLVALHNILVSSGRKTTYENLCKCEEVLKRLLPPKNKTQKESIQDQSSHWCQPFLTAVAESTKSALGVNTLKQTFGPALHVIYGKDLSLSKNAIVAGRKRKASNNANDIPHVVQGELARLDNRFIVSRDESSTTYVKEEESRLGLRLQCKLRDTRLPLVPPLKFILPKDYPSTNPICDKFMELYDTSGFFTDVRKQMLNNLKKFHNKFSMTALLETWAASVNQVSNRIQTS